MRFLLLIGLGLGALPLLATVVTAQETHPFGVRDLIAFDRVSDPQISPDGTRLVFVVSAVDLDANKRRTDLWLSSVDGTDVRRLTQHDANDSSPRWSADGHWIFFLSTRSKSSQIWRIAPDGGEAQPVTTLPLDVGSFALSRDGASIALTLEVFPGSSIAETKTRLDEIAAAKSTGRVYDHLLYRHWDAWADGRRSHLFVMPAKGGDPVDVMKAMDADAPPKPFGGDEEYTFTPDGRGLVFSAKDVGGEEAWSTNFDLWLASADGGSPPRNLTSSNKASDGQPTFSPDGKTLAWLAMARPGFEADRFRIVVRDWPDGKDRVLTESWDRSPGSLTWSTDGRSLYCAADNLGHVSLFAVDVRSGTVRTVVKDGTVKTPKGAGSRIVYSLETLTSPAELFSVAADGTDLRRITDLNRSKLGGVRMGVPEQMTFRGAGGDTVYAWIVRPVDFDPAKKYPVGFLIHGGPQGSFGNDFHYRWNPQAYAGRGYAAVMVDFHGSTGYGQAFTDAIRGDWGGKPFEDLQKGLDAALQRYPWMDGSRVAALGASYGGYMVNWIAGAWPDRFRCLVSHDGNLDERMAYFDTEELWFPEWEHFGTPWENPESYRKHNPVELVSKWKTPILVIHSGQDFRVVETQGMSTFSAAQRKGIPSKLLYFPDENHWVLKPQNSIQWHDTVLAWLDQWTK